MRYRKILFFLIILFLLFTGNKIRLHRADKIINEEGQNQMEEYQENPIEEDITEKPEPVFKASSLTDEIIGRISGISYKKNNKISLDDLSYIELTHWGFDGNTHLGEMIVNKKVASDVVEIFKELYKKEFPIEKVRLIDDYGADDNLSMEDNNSSAFCYRRIVGSDKLSNHSYGLAIDINPIQNPYIRGDLILPGPGEEYLDRSHIRKGMIIKGDPCYKAFKNRGWTWGGEWKSLKDYQHFEIDLQ